MVIVRVTAASVVLFLWLLVLLLLCLGVPKLERFSSSRHRPKTRVYELTEKKKMKFE